LLPDFDADDVERLARLLQVGQVEDLASESASSLAALCKLLEIRGDVDSTPWPSAAWDLDDSPASMVVDLRSQASDEEEDADNAEEPDAAPEGHVEEDDKPPPSVTLMTPLVFGDQPASVAGCGGGGEILSPAHIKPGENLTATEDSQEQQVKEDNENTAKPMPMVAVAKDKKAKKRLIVSQMDPSDLTCKDCNKVFSKPYKLKLHMLIHSKTFPFSCGICGKGFNNKYKMRGHEKGCENRDPNVPAPPKAPQTGVAAKCCPVCGEETGEGGKASLDHHLRLCHPGFKKFLCSSCGEGFKGKKALATHVRESPCFSSGEPVPPPVPLPPPSGPVSCRRCPGSTFATRVELRRHRERVHKIRLRAKCTRCPTVCSTKKALRLHERAVHGVGAELPYACPQCGKQMLKKAHLEDHLNRFHSDKNFSCQLCLRRFATRQDLSRHVASRHKETRPERVEQFRCQQCLRTFSHQSTLRQHARTHLTNRPYKCIPCGKAFGLLCVLVKHQKAHERKGDNTRLVRAPKGRRGCLSYVEARPAGEEEEAAAADVVAAPQQPDVQQPQPIEVKTTAYVHSQYDYTTDLAAYRGQAAGQPQAPSAHYAQTHQMHQDEQQQQMMISQQQHHYQQQHMPQQQTQFARHLPQGYQHQQPVHYMMVPSPSTQQQQQIAYQHQGNVIPAHPPQPQSHQHQIHAMQSQQPPQLPSQQPQQLPSQPVQQQQPRQAPADDAEAIALDILGRLFSEQQQTRRETETPVENL